MVEKSYDIGDGDAKSSITLDVPEFYLNDPSLEKDYVSRVYMNYKDSGLEAADNDPDHPLSGLYPWMARGFYALGQTANSLQVSLGLDNPENAAKDIADYERYIEQVPYDKDSAEALYKLSKSTTAKEWWDTAISWPGLKGITTVAGESLIQAIPTGVAVAGTAAAVGVGAIPLAVGAAATAAIVGLGVLANEVGSSTLDAMSQYLQDKEGTDLKDDKAVAALLSDKERMRDFEIFALKRGIPIAAVDALSFGFAGKLTAAVLRAKKVAEKAGKTFSKLAVPGAVVGEVGIQAPLGGFGEYLGQQVAGQETKLGDILMEVAAEIPGSGPEIAFGIYNRNKPLPNDPADPNNPLANPDIDKIKAIGLATGNLRYIDSISNQEELDIVRSRMAAGGEAAKPFLQRIVDWYGNETIRDGETFSAKGLDSLFNFRNKGSKKAVTEYLINEGLVAPDSRYKGILRFTSKAEQLVNLKSQEETGAAEALKDLGVATATLENWHLQATTEYQALPEDVGVDQAKLAGFVVKKTKEGTYTYKLGTDNPYQQYLRDTLSATEREAVAKTTPFNLDPPADSKINFANSILTRLGIKQNVNGTDFKSAQEFADEYVELQETLHLLEGKNKASSLANTISPEQSERIAAIKERIKRMGNVVQSGIWKRTAIEQNVAMPKPFFKESDLDIRSQRVAKVSTRLTTATTPTTFRTAKGSSYKVEDDGTTIRDKAQRPEDAPNDSGIQPKSENTIYMTDEQVNKVDTTKDTFLKNWENVQDAVGATPWKSKDKTILTEISKGVWGLKYISGKNKGRIIKSSIVTVGTSPQVGLTPVEVWKGGEKVHFGNKIVEVTEGTIGQTVINSPITKTKDSFNDVGVRNYLANQKLAINPNDQDAQEQLIEAITSAQSTGNVLSPEQTVADQGLMYNDAYLADMDDPVTQYFATDRKSMSQADKDIANARLDSYLSQKGTAEKLAKGLWGSFYKLFLPTSIAAKNPIYRPFMRFVLARRARREQINEVGFNGLDKIFKNSSTEENKLMSKVLVLFDGLWSSGVLNVTTRPSNGNTIIQIPSKPPTLTKADGSSYQTITDSNYTIALKNMGIDPSGGVIEVPKATMDKINTARDGFNRMYDVVAKSFIRNALQRRPLGAGLKELEGDSLQVIKQKLQQSVIESLKEFARNVPLTTSRLTKQGKNITSVDLFQDIKDLSDNMDNINGSTKETEILNAYRSQIIQTIKADPKMQAFADQLENSIAHLNIIKLLNNFESTRQRHPYYIPRQRHGNYFFSVYDNVGKRLVHYQSSTPETFDSDTLSNAGWKNQKSRITKELQALKDSGVYAGDRYTFSGIKDRVQTGELKKELDLKDIHILEEMANVMGFNKNAKEVTAFFKKLEDTITTEGFNRYLEQRDANNIVHGYFTPQTADNYLTSSLSAYIRSGADTASNLEYYRPLRAAQVELHAANKNLGNLADKMIQNINDPAERGSMAKAFAFHFAIGGNFSSAIVNLSQPFVATAPVLKSLVGFNRGRSVVFTLVKALNDARKMFKLSGNLSAYGFNFDSPTVPDNLKGNVTPKEWAMLRDLYQKGIIQAVMNIDQGATYQAAMGQISVLPKNTGNFLAKMLELNSVMFGGIEQINRIGTALAAHRLYNQSEKTRANFAKYAKYGIYSTYKMDANVAAEMLVMDTQYLISKENRPELFHGGVMNVATQFLPFVMHYVGMYAKSMRMIGTDPKMGSIYLGSLVLGMMAFGGLMGLPFGENLRYILKKLSSTLGAYEFDLDYGMRKAMQSAGVSKGMEETLMHGAFKTMFGIDLNRRVGVGETIPTDILAGDLSIVGGPSFGIAVDSISRAFNATQGNDIDSGRLLTSFMPIAVRNAYDAMERVYNPQSGLKSSQGRMILPNKDITLGDNLKSAVGFTPENFANARQAIQEARQLEMAPKARQDKYLGKLAEAISNSNQALGRGDKETYARKRAILNELFDEIREINKNEGPERRVNVSKSALAERIRTIEQGQADPSNLIKNAPKNIRGVIAKEISDKQGGYAEGGDVLPPFAETYYRWRKEFGGTDQERRMKGLEKDAEGGANGGWSDPAFRPTHVYMGLSPGERPWKNEFQRQMLDIEMDAWKFPHTMVEAERTGQSPNKLLRYNDGTVGFGEYFGKGLKNYHVTDRPELFGEGNVSVIANLDENRTEYTAIHEAAHAARAIQGIKYPVLDVKIMSEDGKTKFKHATLDHEAQVRLINMNVLVLGDHENDYRYFNKIFGLTKKETDSLRNHPIVSDAQMYIGKQGQDNRVLPRGNAVGPNQIKQGEMQHFPPDIKSKFEYLGGKPLPYKTVTITRTDEVRKAMELAEQERKKLIEDIKKLKEEADAFNSRKKP